MIKRANLGVILGAFGAMLLVPAFAQASFIGGKGGGGIGGGLGDLGKKISDTGKKAGGAVSDAAKKTGGTVSDAAKKTVGKVTNTTKKTGGKIASDAKKLGGKVSSETKKVAGKVSSTVKKKHDPSVELWGEAGRKAYVAAAATMKTRNAGKNPIRLTAHQKQLLRPHFGGLVDNVRIYYGSPPVNEWKAAGKKIHLGGEEAAAQTYGYRVYIAKRRKDMSKAKHLGLLLHELHHTKQYERYGKSLSNFGYHYFKEYKMANQSYENNRLEKEADQGAAHLKSKILAAGW